ncbi:MAG: hypothetical protein JXB26_12805 [Candidatus Aminicenantes bacterium]|nr:hypothetical protein [Candidatus Aminicenantes bacterium]
MSEVHDKIKTMIQGGKLYQVVMIDTEGMIIDSIGNEYNSENLASLFFPSHTFMETIREELGVAGVEEISIETKEKGHKIILRYLPVEEMHFYLITVCPASVPQQMVMSQVVRIFYSRIMGIPEEEVPESISGPPQEGPAMQSARREMERETQKPIVSAEKAGPSISSGVPIVTPELKQFFGKLTEEIKKADIVVGGKSASEISEEAVDLISYKLLKNLSSNVIEKMLQKVFLQITNGLINQEISVIKKELDSLFRS